MIKMLRSLFIRNSFFTIIQPGIVAGLVPYLLLRLQDDELWPLHLSLVNYIGLFLLTTGLIMLLTCIIRFATEGKGTLSPIDPTRFLVIKGLYQYSRNPMYIGVILILMGEAIFFLSIILSIYTVIIFTAFHLFILLHEEPRLRKVFGESYNKYCKEVKRWI